MRGVVNPWLEESVELGSCLVGIEEGESGGPRVRRRWCTARTLVLDIAGEMGLLPGAGAQVSSSEEIRTCAEPSWAMIECTERTSDHFRGCYSFCRYFRRNWKVKHTSTPVQSHQPPFNSLSNPPIPMDNNNNMADS